MERIIQISIETTFGTASVKGRLDKSEIIFNLGETRNKIYLGNINVPEIEKVTIIPNMYYGDKIVINENLEFKLEMETWNGNNSGLVLEKEED